MTVKMGLVAIVAAGAVGLAACSSTSGSRSSPPSTSPNQSTTTSTSASPSTTAMTTQNLVVTDDIRAQLLDAGAALNNVPASSYMGLVPGGTYYADDATTQTYWASAALVPSSSSTQAQVSVQDDGSYLLFDQPAGGSWTAYDVGLVGIEGATCPVTVPAAILSLWNRPAGTCRPSTPG